MKKEFLNIFILMALLMDFSCSLKRDNPLDINNPNYVTCNYPSNLNAVALTYNSEQLTWDTIGNAISYNVLYISDIISPILDTIFGVKTNSLILSNLLASTQYTFQIQAVCSGSNGKTGESEYSNQSNFTTNSSSLATLTTVAASSITPSSAQSGGVISSNGGATITSKGICWSSNASPTVALGNFTIDGSGSVSFTSSISGLNASTTYYVRAYATNSAGTSYGNQVSFNTAAANLATLTTVAANSITQATAQSGGIISSNGGATITSKGVCWSTSATPTIGLGNFTIDGSGSGNFTSNISGLSAGTTYYIRAYATNSVGTAYGNQVAFTTSALAIGQSYQGGIIAYILQSGDPGYNSTVTHGLIAAPNDQSTGIQWYNDSFVSAGDTNTAIGSGLSNTNAIIAAQGAGNYAAMLCHNLTLGGYTDWYLPSLNELIKLLTYKSTIGGFSATSYWSSSEDANFVGYRYAWSVGFEGYGYQLGVYKSNIYNVRAVRSF